MEMVEIGGYVELDRPSVVFESEESVVVYSDESVVLD